MTWVTDGYLTLPGCKYVVGECVWLLRENFTHRGIWSTCCWSPTYQTWAITKDENKPMEELRLPLRQSQRLWVFKETIFIKSTLSTKLLTYGRTPFCTVIKLVWQGNWYLADGETAIRQDTTSDFLSPSKLCPQAFISHGWSLSSESPDRTFFIPVFFQEFFIWDGGF